jgi:hypothetical protein
MERAGVRKAMQIFLTILGVVAVVAGSVTILFGATSIVGVEDPSPAVDSEMRFFAVWYAAAGMLVLRVVPRVETSGGLIRGVAAAFFVAGCARGLSWAVVGKPPAIAVLLMVIELALPFVLIPWQAALERGA